MRDIKFHGKKVDRGENEQIAWQRAVIREEMLELQEQWDKAITDDWLDKEETK